MNKRRTVEHTDPDGQRLCWPFSFDGLRSPQTNDQTSATGGNAGGIRQRSAWPAVVGLVRVAAAHPVQETGRAPFAEIAAIGQGVPSKIFTASWPWVGAPAPKSPPQGFPRVPPPDSPGIGAFRPPNPPTCIVRPKSLHVQAERPSLDSARPFFRRLKTGKRKPPGG